MKTFIFSQVLIWALILVMNLFPDAVMGFMFDDMIDRTFNRILKEHVHRAVDKAIEDIKKEELE